MTGTEQDAQGATTVTEDAPSLLDQAIGYTVQTEPERAQELVKTLVEEAMKGTVTYSKNLTQTFNAAINTIDEQLSRQVAAIMHHEKFKKLEGSWRGLHYLVMNSETGTSLKIRTINVSKKDLHKDLTKAVEFDQSQIFRKIYESEFGTAGGEPYGALIGDYEFSSHPEDMEVLSGMSNVAAAAFAPFLSAASPKMFGLDSYTDLSKPRDLAKIFETAGIHEVAELPRQRGQPLRHTHDAAGPGPSALWRGNQDDRGIRLRGGAAGRSTGLPRAWSMTTIAG